MVVEMVLILGIITAIIIIFKFLFGFGDCFNKKVHIDYNHLVGYVRD